MKVKLIRDRDVNKRRWPSAVALLMTLVVTNVGVATQAAHVPGQEKSATSQQQTTNEEKEKDTMITGIVVNEKGLPVKGQALELYMVVNGIARDAYGAPLRGAVTIGPNRQILGLMMFPVKSETDDLGRFSMKLPKYVMVPSGLEMIGWTIVSVDASAPVRALSVKGEMATIIPKPEAPKIDLGKLTLSPPAVEVK
jgi:hypothetical protein